MNYWNLLVVLCFVVLYLGIALVFIQLRRLRDDLEGLELGMRESGSGNTGGSRECAERIQQSMLSMEENLHNRSRIMFEDLREELDAIRSDLRFMGQSGGGGGIRGNVIAESTGNSSKSDAYREARLLLANGVDEERVITETGLTVEEVSLLKRIANQNQDGE